MPKFFSEVLVKVEAPNEEVARAMVEAAADAGYCALLHQPSRGVGCSVAIMKPEIYSEMAYRRRILTEV